MQTLVAPILFAALFQAVSTPSRAEILVTGAVNAVRLEARKASLEQVLDALGSLSELHYQTSVAFSESITGNYNGSLREVVSRLLQGYNFVIIVSAGIVDVKVYGASNLPNLTQSVCTRRTRIPVTHQ